MKLRNLVLILCLAASKGFAEGIADASEFGVGQPASKGPVAFKDLQACYTQAHHFFEKPKEEFKFIFIDSPEIQEFMGTKSYIGLGSQGFSVRKTKGVDGADEEQRIRIEDQRQISVLRNFTLKEINTRFKEFSGLLTAKLSRQERPELSEAMVKNIAESFCVCEQAGISLKEIDRVRSTLISQQVGRPRYQVELAKDKSIEILSEKHFNCENFEKK